MDDALTLNDRFQVWAFSLSNGEQAEWLEDFRALVADGFTTSEAIAVMAETGDGSNRIISLRMQQALAAGDTLYEAMSPFFALAIAESMRIYETLDHDQAVRMLDRLIRAFSTGRKDLLQAVFKLLYPVLVLVIGLALPMVMSGVFEDVARSIPMNKWPDLVVMFYQYGSWLRASWWVIPTTVVALVVGVGWVLLNYAGPLRETLDALPVFSHYRRIVGGRMLSQVGLMVGNGLKIADALAVIDLATGHAYVRAHVHRVLDNLAQGVTPGAAFNTGMLPYKIALRLERLAAVKSPGDALDRIGVRAAEDATRSAIQLLRIIGYILLAIGAVSIAWSGMSMYLLVGAAS